MHCGTCRPARTAWPGTGCRRWRCSWRRRSNVDTEPLVVRADLVIPAGELREELSRSGGPGGQNVNKVSTRVTLRWSIAASRVLDAARRQRLLTRLASRLTREGELLVHCDETRSQLQNRAA